MLCLQVEFQEVFEEPEVYKDNVLGRVIGGKVILIGFLYLFNYVQVLNNLWLL